MTSQPLYLHRVLLDPPVYNEDTTFRPGLNIIWAESTAAGQANSVGKTTLKNLIDYGLGKTDFLPKDKLDRLSQLHDRKLVLMFSCHGRSFTLRRGLNNEDTCIVLRGWHTKERNNELEFTGDLAGYRVWLENQIWNGRNRPADILNISLRQTMLMLARDQKIGFSALEKAIVVEKKKVTHDRLTFLLGFVTPKRIDARRELKKASDLVEENKSTPKILEKFLSTQDISEAEITKRLQPIETKFETYRLKQRQLIEKLEQIELSEVRTLSEKISLKRHKFEMLGGNLVVVQTRIEQYSSARAEAAAEIEELDLLVEAKQVFDSFPRIFCPNCAAEIPVDLLDSYVHQCAGENPEDADEPDLTAIEERKLVLKYEIEDLARGIQELRTQANEVEAARNAVGYEIEAIQKHLGDLTVPNTQELIKLNDIIHQTEQEIDGLIRTQNLYRRKDVLLEQLKGYRAELREAQKKVNDIDVEEKDRRLKFAGIYDDVISFLYQGKRIGVVDPASLRPQIQHVGEKTVDDGAAALAVATIAYDLALLEFGIEIEDSEHPRVLIHDSPAQYEIDHNTYGRVFDWAIVHENEGEEFQYIITTLYIPEKIRTSYTEYIRKHFCGGDDSGKLFGFTF